LGGADFTDFTVTAFTGHLQAGELVECPHLRPAAALIVKRNAGETADSRDYILE